MKKTILVCLLLNAFTTSFAKEVSFEKAKFYDGKNNSCSELADTRGDNIVYDLEVSLFDLSEDGVVAIEGDVQLYRCELQNNKYIWAPVDASKGFDYKFVNSQGKVEIAKLNLSDLTIGLADNNQAVINQNSLVLNSKGKYTLDLMGQIDRSKKIDGKVLVYSFIKSNQTVTLSNNETLDLGQRLGGQIAIKIQAD